MTYIYGIFIGDVCYYIGQTKNVDRRFKEHMLAIKEGTHTVKALNKGLNKVDVDTDVEMRVIAKIDSDNSFIVMMCEACYNSIYCPKNRIVWRAGRNTVTFKRVSKELAEKLLECIKLYT